MIQKSKYSIFYGAVIKNKAEIDQYNRCWHHNISNVLDDIILDNDSYFYPVICDRSSIITVELIENDDLITYIEKLKQIAKETDTKTPEKMCKYFRDMIAFTPINSPDWIICKKKKQ